MEDDYAYIELRKQVEVIYYREDYRPDSRESEFIIDLCKYSEPTQIVLAKVAPKATLMETLVGIGNKIKNPPNLVVDDPILGPNEVLRVPNVNWRILHHFKELEGQGKTILNNRFQDYYLQEAVQIIDFKLDRSGVELKTQAKINAVPIPRYFLFNGPFLIYMKKRGGKDPFFVMWVDNAELLSKW